MPPKSKIPDRWIPYNACGSVIEGTRIICFKVPLSKHVQYRVPGITKIWDIPTVLEEIPKLGAVIDLTNTARYYNPREFEEANVIHRKILMPGREIPPENKVQEFMDAVDEFLGKDCGSLVGVHCTHGLNRTGYMVCRYMKDRLNIPGEEAIEKFEKARGYKIERNIYIASILEKKVPRPESFKYGKETVIKPYNQNNMSDVDSPEENYDSNYDNSQHYNKFGSNRYKNDGYTGNSYNSRYSGSSNNDRHNGSSYKDRADSSSNSDGYLSWRRREASSSYSLSSRGTYRYDGNSYRRNSDRSSSERSGGYSYAHDY